MLGGDHEVHRNLLLLEHDEGHLARAVPEVRGSTAEVEPTMMMMKVQ